jgi:ribosomal protein S30
MPGHMCRAGSGKARSRTPRLHVDEKSDVVIVPRKRSNKRRQLLAEVVEGRASLKGNSRQTAVAHQTKITTVMLGRVDGFSQVAC